MTSSSEARRVYPSTGSGIVLVTMLIATACQQQAASDNVVRELAGAREELAAQRARMDGIIDRLDRLERLVVRDEDDAVASRSTLPVVATDGGVQGPGARVIVAGDSAPDLLPMVVAVSERKLVVGGNEVDRNALAERFRAHIGGNAQAPVVLRIASGVTSGRTSAIVDIAREQGVTQLAVVHEGTEKKEKTRKKRRR